MPTSGVSCMHSRSQPNPSYIRSSKLMNKQVSVPQYCNWLPNCSLSPLLHRHSTMCSLLTEAANRMPGQIEDLCNLLAEDWVALGSVHEMGDATQKFFRAEMEKSWGEKHLCIFSEEEAKKWVLGLHMSSTSWSCCKAIHFGSASWSTSTPSLHLFP